MKVFISYSTAFDQIIALRLQTMAAVYGMVSYVPPATTRQLNTSQLTTDVTRNLQDSDVILAVITHNPVPSALSEMNFALQASKLLIPIIGVGVAPEYYEHFRPYFVVNADDPSTTEQDIVGFLAQKQQAESTKTGLLALATLTVALLLFGAVGSESK
jgi:hypothetical protein